MLLRITKIISFFCHIVKHQPEKRSPYADLLEDRVPDHSETYHLSNDVDHNLQYHSEALVKLKRDSEFHSWSLMNHAATNIQKVFKRVIERDQLMHLLEEKYSQHMIKPTLLL